MQSDQWRSMTARDHGRHPCFFRCSYHSPRFNSSIFTFAVLILTFSIRTNGQPLRDDERFSRYWAIASILLILVTYRLWIPAQWTQTEYYPSIPFVAVPHWLSLCVSMLLVPVLGAASAVLVLVPRRARCQRAAWLGVAVALAMGFLTDQHRLQPWAYQTFLYAWMFVLLPASLRMNAFRILTISIYFYSSIGKFDYQFLHTVGQEFLVAAAEFAHLDWSAWSDRNRLIMAAGFPAAELSIAILLMIPRSRPLGGCLAIAMHTGLIALLSPWGMHHSSAVIVWNAILAGQAYWLFVRRPSPQADVLPVGRYRSLGVVLVGALLLLAITLPLTERRGRYDRDAWHWDHWTSWALYSPHNSRVDVEVYAGIVDSLPPALQSAIIEETDGGSWRKLDLGRLSLEARGVHVLPQARYQLQLAIAIARAQGWTHEIRGVVRSASDRRDGSRTEIWMNHLGAMQKADHGRSRGCRLNRFYEMSVSIKTRRVSEGCNVVPRLPVGLRHRQPATALGSMSA